MKTRKFRMLVINVETAKNVGCYNLKCPADRRDVVRLVAQAMDNGHIVEIIPMVKTEKVGKQVLA